MNKVRKVLNVLIFLLMSPSAFVFAEEAERTVINIENARNTQYQKDKETGNDIIVLSGNVKVSVTKGSTKNVITADTIRYDRTSEMMYADGNVTLEQTTQSAGSQNVSASSLMFNTSTLEGVFDDGRVVQVKSDAINLPSGSTLIVASDIFGRSESNTIAFKNGVLTFCDDEDPHWNIKASRIWLLPGGEFAFLNALLYVGPVPVFYLPAFYYPKDELIFNPVFGYEKRNGYFMQNTFYVYGRKPLETSSASTDDSDSAEKLKALFNFVKPSSLKEQKLEGLMLHNLDEDYKGDTSNYFKILGDYYSNLGYMVGAEGIFKPKKIFSNLETGLHFGFSNTVFSADSYNYDPYSKTGKKYMDSSNLLGFELPFRYSGNLKLSIVKPFSLSLSFPVYSDPFFHDDFTYNRSETMDWISYLIDSQNLDTTEDTVNEVSSFTWTLDGSYSVPLPSVVKPYLNNASFSLKSSLAFSTMTVSSDSDTWNDLYSKYDVKSLDQSEWRANTPLRKFYYPSQITPVTFSADFSGTIIDYSSSRIKNQASSSPVSFVTSLSVPDELIPESEKQKELSQSKNDESDENEDSETEGNVLPDSVFPSLIPLSVSGTEISGLTFTSTYSVKPYLTTQLAYSSENLKKADDFDWSNLKTSMYTLKVPVNLTNRMTYGGNFFSINNSWSYEPVWQEHPYINSETSGYSLKKADYAAAKQDISNTNGITLKPFCYVPAIKETNITWNSTIKVIRTEFLADEYVDENSTPEWKYHTVDWSDDKCITANSLSFTFATNQLDSKFTQSLTFTSTLQPLVENYYGTLRFGFPYSTLAFETGVKKSSSASDADWVKQPFKQSATVSAKVLGSQMSFSESYNYNLEENYHDALKLNFNWMSFSFAYQMSYTYGYDMTYKDDGTPLGWKIRTEKEFLPFSFSVSYNPQTKTLYTWKNRISLGCGVNTSVVADLLRPTSSYFTFTPAITFNINKFLNFSFSSTSRNSVIYRYFGNDVEIPGEKNMFTDLWNSFRFDDENLRKSSGFKLKSLNFSLTHELHDWDFNTTFKIEPKVKTVTSGGVTKNEYQFDPYITINIIWRPMGAMKTEIVDNYGEWELK